MKLFHGSNIEIEGIDLGRGLKYKDFGQGFYLTPDFETAQRMAIKKAHLFGGEPTITIYKFDEVGLTATDLRVKIFPEKATVEWLLFIDRNRDHEKSPASHEFDIVVGPIADDGVVLQLTNLHMHLITAEETAKRLQDRFLDQQYYFGSEKALTFLTKVDVWKK